MKTFQNKEGRSVTYLLFPLIAFTVLLIVLVFQIQFRSSFFGDDELSLYILDVGQGDSILIKRSKFSMLVDGGPGVSINYYLNKLYFPFCNIDSILLTHPHADHLSGLDLVLDKCRVGTVFQNEKININKQNYNRWYEKVVTKPNTQNVFVYKDYVLDVKDLKIYVLWPPKDYTKKATSNLNDLSIVLFLDYKDFEAILLSDVEETIQNKLI